MLGLVADEDGFGAGVERGLDHAVEVALAGHRGLVVDDKVTGLAGGVQACAVRCRALAVPTQKRRSGGRRDAALGLQLAGLGGAVGQALHGPAPALGSLAHEFQHGGLAGASGALHAAELVGAGEELLRGVALLEGEVKAFAVLEAGEFKFELAFGQDGGVGAAPGFELAVGPAFAGDRRRGGEALAAPVGFAGDEGAGGGLGADLGEQVRAGHPAAALQQGFLDQVAARERLLALGERVGRTGHQGVGAGGGLQVELEVGVCGKSHGSSRRDAARQGFGLPALAVCGGVFAVAEGLVVAGGQGRGLARVVARLGFAAAALL